MRDDVKIGVAIGVVLVVGALLYFLFSDPSEDEPIEQQPQTRVSVNEGPPATTRSANRRPWEVVNETPAGSGTGTSTTPPPGGTRTAPTTGSGTTGRRADPNAGPGISVADPGTGSTAASGTTTPPGGTATSGTRTPPGGTTGSGATGSGSTGSATTGAGGTGLSTSSGAAPTTGSSSTAATGSGATSASGTTTPATGSGARTQRTYVVKEGDRGFWGISQEVYGDGKYYVLIEKANPDKKAERLMPGDTLIIPPLPNRPSDADRRGEILTGAPTGSTTYTVQEGDAGFWGIAVTLYGNGKYFHLIERANPGVDPTRLRAGQVLVIPPKDTPTTSSSGTGGTTGDDDGPVISDGQRTYTIQSEDSAGLWGIARKLYGDANLYPAIKAANPGLDSTQLTPGQKIVVPSKEEAQRMAGTTSGSTGGTSSGGSTGGTGSVEEPTDGRPIFD